MSDQLKVALFRGLVGGVVQAGVVFFGTLGAFIGTAGHVTDTGLIVAGVAAGAAFFGTLAVRFGAEGLIDTQAANAVLTVPKP